MKTATKPERMSLTRKIYFARLIFRCMVFVIAFYLYIFKKEVFDIAVKFNFFKKLSVFHILWLIWMWDMVLQLIPIKAHISIGSQKHLSLIFKPIKEKVNYDNLKKYIVDTTKSAYLVMTLWILLCIVIGALYISGIIDVATTVMITMLFYVADLVCVLIWCPFRLIMGSKCCTTCRIFNWDHFMMFSPLITVAGFFSWSLVIVSVIVLIIWEVCVFTYPERFWENSNMALKCSECTDKLCTQYCRKLRK